MDNIFDSIQTAKNTNFTTSLVVGIFGLVDKVLKNSNYDIIEVRNEVLEAAYNYSIGLDVDEVCDFIQRNLDDLIDEQTK